MSIESVWGAPAKRPKTFLAAFLVLIACGLASLTAIRFDPDTDSFFDMTASHAVHTRELDAEFGGGGGEIIVTVTAEDIFTARNLTIIEELSEEFEALEHVEKVISLTTLNEMIGEEDTFYVEKLVGEIPTDPKSMADLRKRCLANPLYVKNVVSADGRTAGIVLKVEKNEGGDELYKTKLVSAVRSLAAERADDALQLHVSGHVVMDSDYMGFMQHDVMIFLPFALALMTVVLMLALRNLKLMLATLITVNISLLFTTSLFFIFGFKVNAVTSTVPPIIIGVVIGDSIQFVVAWVRNRVGGSVASLEQTIQRMRFPCFMTSITTWAGFMSLLMSDSPAMRQLGAVAAWGVLIAYAVNFTFLPALLRVLRIPGGEQAMMEASDSRAGRIVDGAMERLARFCVGHKKTIVIVAALLLPVAALLTTRIRVETSLLEQLDPHSDIYNSTVFIERNFTGVQVLYVSLKHAAEEGFKNPEALRYLESLQEFIVGTPGVDKAISVVDFVREMNRSFHAEDDAFYKIPETRDAVAQYALLYDAEDLEDYMDASWQWAVLRVRLTEHTTRGTARIVGTIQDYLERNPPQGLEHELLGQARTELEGTQTVVTGQIRSFATAFVIVFAMMFVVFRSVSAGLATLLPNVMPLAANFAIMAIFGIKLDTATAVISAVGIGIIVDNTIHFIDGYAEAVLATGDPAEAVRRSLLQRGRAMLFTTLVLTTSFGVMIFSSFVPVYQFGLLCSILMLTALVGDILVLPAMVAWVQPRFPARRHFGALDNTEK